MKRGMISVIALFILSVLNPFKAYATVCSNQLGTCDYYQCLEKQEKCGKKGYYVDFAEKYCLKYQKEQSEYTKSGQEFLNHIRLCLQQKLETTVVQNEKRPGCKEIKKIAIATHKECYNQYKFCELPESDQRKIKFTAKKEVLDFQVLKFAIWLEKACH